MHGVEYAGGTALPGRRTASLRPPLLRYSYATLTLLLRYSYATLTLLRAHPPTLATTTTTTTR
jgi:hypothetical protein